MKTQTIEAGSGGGGDLAYDERLKAEVPEALDDPSPPVAHDEAVRQIRAAIKAE